MMVFNVYCPFVILVPHSKDSEATANVVQLPWLQVLFSITGFDEKVLFTCLDT